MEVAKTTTIPLNSSKHYESLQIHRQLINRIDVLHDALKVEIEYTRRFLEQIHAYNARPVSVLATENDGRRELPKTREDEYAALRNGSQIPSHNQANVSQERSHHLPSSLNPEIKTTSITTNNHNHSPLFPHQSQQQSSLPTSLKSCKCCQQRLASEERELRSLEKKVRGLEGRVKGFEEMPPDKEKALMEVEKMKRQLDGLMSKRNRLFKDMVKEGGELG